MRAAFTKYKWGRKAGAAIASDILTEVSPLLTELGILTLKFRNNQPDGSVAEATEEKTQQQDVGANPTSRPKNSVFLLSPEISSESVSKILSL